MSRLTDDRELLKKAAKAFGYRKETDWWDGWSDEGRETGDYWNPLTDDGDALRLAVKLHMEISTYDDASSSASVCFKNGEFYKSFDAFEKHEYDAYAATRKAIVRAAAAIGEGM